MPRGDHWARTRVERFLANVEEQPNGCWRWKGYVREDGYGRWGTRGAHRVAYELLVGPIPAGLTIDHTCHNADESCEGGSGCLHRRCVNPAHLEPVPGKTNTLRGKSPTARNARATHCSRGHELSGDNLRILKTGRRAGKRVCRTCHNAHAADIYSRDRDALLEEARQRRLVNLDEYRGRDRERWQRRRRQRTAGTEE
jgi:hypothetical protein